MVKVKLKYFSRIRETIGKTSELVEIESTNIKDLIEELQAMGEQYSVLKRKRLCCLFRDRPKYSYRL